MRKELYKALCERLSQIDEIKHIDLWNNNVEFIEQETAWERPAVFIEFKPIYWTQVKEKCWRSKTQVSLHIVSDWNGSSAANSDKQDEILAIYDLSDKIVKVIEGLNGKSFSRLTLSETHTSHNHEDIVENIDVYSYSAIRTI